MNIWLKYLLTAGIVILVSEFAKRSDRLGAFIGSLPFVTMLVMIWLFVDRQPVGKIANHASYTFWYVIPTLPMFLLIPWLLNRGWNFWVTLGMGALLTFLCFGVAGVILKRFEIHLW